MPEYRRAYRPGGTFFFTIVTYERRRLFHDEAHVQGLRQAVAAVRDERSFKIKAAVILPDHLHFIWTLPPGDNDYSWRIGRMKVLFTKSLHQAAAAVGSAHPTESRQRHRESNVWQRRFWEHVIRDKDDYENHFNYIHYNPVKHGLASCPHAWPHSSFTVWVGRQVYDTNWCCACQGGVPPRRPYPDELDQTVGE